MGGRCCECTDSSLQYTLLQLVLPTTLGGSTGDLSGAGGCGDDRFEIHDLPLVVFAFPCSFIREQ